MAHIETSIHINRPPAEVFAFVAEGNNNAQWHGGSTSSRSDGPPGVGTRTTEVSTFLGQKIENVTEITVYEPPTRMVMRSVGGPLQFEAEFRLEEMSGGTHATFTGEVEGGGVFKLAEGAFAGQVKKQIESDAERLKGILEA